MLTLAWNINLYLTWKFNVFFHWATISPVLTPYDVWFRGTVKEPIRYAAKPRDANDFQQRIVAVVRKIPRKMCLRLP
jgi:hypothetical protein